MERSKNQCHESLETFQKRHPRFFQQPVVQSFVRNEKHRELVRQAICFPTKQNMRLVDEAFQAFYSNVRVLSYLAKAVHSKAIDFDKAAQKHANREMLTLDQPLRAKENEEGATHKDMLYQPSPDMTNRMACETMGNYIEDPPLYQAIQSLTTKQQEILTYKYVRQWSSKEIAELFGDSPQNVSKLHQKALQRLKNQLKKEPDHYDDN